jgi:hypothetical protein
MGGLLTGVDGVELRGKSEQEYAAVLQSAGARAVFEVRLLRLDSAFKALQGSAFRAEGPQSVMA